MLGWLIAGLCAVIAWFAALGLIARRSRAGLVQAGPATQELGPEPPAIVHLLTNRWHIAPEAVEATLMDLAARGFISIERIGADPHEAVCRVNTGHEDGLMPYENQVLARVSNSLVDDVVPLAALAQGDPFTAKVWLRIFQREVIADARAHGLSRPRLPWELRAALLALAWVPGLLIGAGVSAGLGTPFGILTGIPVIAALSRLAFAIRGERDTPAGRRAAARWLGVRTYLAAHPTLAAVPPAGVVMWGRYLAYAAATWVAKETLRVLELGSSEDKHAWSPQSGSWRKIRVRYPRRRSWGRYPGVALGYGTAWVVWGVFMLWFPVMLLSQWSTALAVLLGIVGAIGLGWGIAAIARAGTDLLSPQTKEGLALRVRTKKRLTLYVGRRRRLRQYGRTYIAVDDGNGDLITATVLTPNAKYAIDENDVVRIHYGRCFGFVSKVEILRHARDWQQAPKAGRYDPAIDDTPADPLDPSMLVTQADVQAALDTTAMPTFTPPRLGPRIPTCGYQTTEGTPTIVTVYSATGEPGFNLMQSVQRRGSLEGGLGDEAYRSEEGIVVRHGSTFVYIQIASSISNAFAHALKPLAQAAVRNIQHAATRSAPVSRL